MEATTSILGLHGLSAADLLALFTHFLMLSLLAVGGAITAAPDMHRYVVGQHHWLSDDLFTASVALAQAAPGPNVLFVAVIGFNAAGLAGAAATLLGIMLPSTTLALWATRWSHARRDTLGVRAFKTGLAPLTLGLLLATGWILADPVRDQPGALVLIGVTIVAVLKTRWSPLWLVALGAVAGALGWV